MPRLKYLGPATPNAHIEDGILVLDLNKIVHSPRAVRPVPERKGWKVKDLNEKVERDQPQSITSVGGNAT